jgi:regulator of cell morphogenesis and NO signaling
MEITSETPVREIAVGLPTAIPVFERFGIDYCCGGKHSLTEACAKRALDVAPVVEELEHQQQRASANEESWQTATLKQLADHIVQKHHMFTREQLELIQNLVTKVERRHGRQHPEVLQLRSAVASIGAELAYHFFYEEKILFPYVAQLEADEKPASPPVFGSVEQPVTRMMMDHDHTANELRQLREITNNYQPPADACTTYRALYSALAKLEQDLHQHIHLENNILFPRAMAAAREQW